MQDREFSFVIFSAGADGIAPVDLLLMTRVLVLEQIYRGFMILGGRKYHK